MTVGVSRMLVALRALALVMVCALCLPVASLRAQDTTADLSPADYAQWEAMATRAETVVDRALASNAALEVLRIQLTEWRTRFKAGQSAQTARLTTLREQIAALGAKPVDGASEPPEIAARRTELEDRLRQMEAPVLAATEAYQRADGLVGEVDRIIAVRQTEALFDRERGALNPATWLPATQSVMTYLSRVGREAEPVFSANGKIRLQNNMVLIGLYAIAALLLILRSGTWLGRAQARILAMPEGPMVRLSVFLLSACRVLLPVLGLVAAVRALDAAGFSGIRIDALMGLMPLLGLVILGGRWLGLLAFPNRNEQFPILSLTPPNRAEGRWHATVLGLLLAASMVLDTAGETGEDISAYTSVLLFPAILLAGLVLVRLALLLIAHARKVIRSTDDALVVPRAVRFVGQTVVGVGCVAPVLSGLGYTNAATSMLWPTVLSLGLLALLSTLQALIFDLFALVTRRSEAARDALAPTLVGFALGMASIPVFALIWGMRPATLSEIWASFLGGIKVGGATISPSNFLTFAIVFAIGYTLTRMLQGVLRNSVLPKTRLDSGGKNAILSGTGYVGFFAAALVAITLAGIDLSGLAIVAGALSVGIGFGLQTIVSNFVSGIILLIERPIKLGDWISVGGVSGYVRDISVRSTRIETFDRQDVIVPNADLIAGVVTNYTLGNATGRVIVPVGVAYGTDTRRVDALLRKIAEAHPMVLLDPKPNVVFTGFGADSLNFEIRAFLRDVNWMLSVKSDMNHEIAALFMKEGIEIPFAQRDLWIRNPEVLTGRAPAQDPDTAPPLPPKPEAI
jgi:potassium efflux system protein